MRKLGPYVLSGHLGTGGMCDVWRATRSDGTVAAAKVLRSEFAPEMLRDEIHLMAQLDHPNIVNVHGWGDATPAEAAALELNPGTPWIAMELAHGGSFDTRSITNWAELRHLAVSLLSALMHSHARAVIHRDLKPGNVLVMDDSPRFALSDFGIAFPKGRFRNGTFEVRLVAAGTLAYISPEQVLGRWRDFGRYTDLFSLGVMLYEVATGTLPFQGSNRVSVAMAHTAGPPPIEAFRFGVPTGFEDWLRTLLAYAPSDRYAFAADAMHGLLELGDAYGSAQVHEAAASADLPTMLNVLDVPRTDDPGPIDASGLRATIHLGGSRTPFPSDWRDPSGRDKTVGREHERDAMWSTLIDVATRGVNRTVVIRGQSGAGASYLARWICIRACELGAADYVPIHQSGAGTVLPETISHVLSLVGLDASARAERLSDLFKGTDVDLELLTHLVRGRPTSVADQVHVLGQVLGHFAVRRPLVIWVDDVHGDIELLEVAARASTAAHPMMFVLTVQDDTLATSEEAKERLTALVAGPGTTELQLTPFSNRETAELIQRSTPSPLAPQVVDQIIGYARGNPMHALQLARVWRATGKIPSGSITDVWHAKIDHELRPEERRALVVAAIQSERVSLELWRRLCRKVGVASPENLPDRLLDKGLWSIDQQGYRFRHASVHEAVLTRPEDAELIREVHGIAASLFNPEFIGNAPRLGRHLVEAGDVSAGAEVVRRAISRFHQDGLTTKAKGLLAWFRRVLDEQQVPADSAIRMQFELVSAYEAGDAQADERCLRIAIDVANRAERAGEKDILADALRLQSFYVSRTGDWDRGLTLAQRAADCAAGSTDEALLSTVAYRIGRTLIQQGRMTGAREALERAASLGDRLSRISALVALSATLLSLDRPGEARSALVEAAELARDGGSRLQYADAMNGIAELARRNGEFDEAEAHYLETIRVAERAEPTSAATARLNLAAMFLSMSRPADARQLATTVVERGTIPYLQGYAEIVLATSAAMDGLVSVWEDLVGLERPHKGAEFAELWESAGDAWVARGAEGLAADAFREALAAIDGTDETSAPRLRARLNEKLESKH